MGNPIEENPTFGDDCLNGFPAGEAPLELLMVVKGIKRCVWLPSDHADPPEGTFTLIQSSSYPCLYKKNIEISPGWPGPGYEIITLLVAFSVDPHVVQIYSRKFGDTHEYHFFTGFFEGIEAECENTLECYDFLNEGHDGSVWIGAI